MRAVIDWSYGLLSEDEQLFFGLSAYSRAASRRRRPQPLRWTGKDRLEAIDRLADLVAKSLVVADVSGTKPRFRLLETTRAYAIEKLDEGGERQPFARRHADYYRSLFERAEA